MCIHGNHTRHTAPQSVAGVHVYRRICLATVLLACCVVFTTSGVVDMDDVGTGMVALKLHVGKRVTRVLVDINGDNVDALADQFCTLEFVHEAHCLELVRRAAQRAIEIHNIETSVDHRLFWESGDTSMAVVKMNDEATVITVATAVTEGLRRLVGSMLANFPATLYVLGLGMPFVGTVQKLTWTRSFLRRANLSGGIIFVDAYDTIFQKPLLVPHEVVLFGADRICSADVCSGPLVHNRFLNSGSYAGPAALILSLLDIAISTNLRSHRDSDQRILSKTCLERAMPVALDIKYECFAPLDGANFSDEFRFLEHEDRILLASRHSGHVPSVIHGNGRVGKQLLLFHVLPHMADYDDMPHLDEIMAKLSSLATASYLNFEPPVHTTTSDAAVSTCKPG